MKLDWRTCLRLGVTAAVLFLFIHYWESLAGLLILAVSAAKPLIIGAVIAYVVNILMCFYEHYYFTGKRFKKNGKERIWVSRSRRVVCMILAYLSVVGIVLMIFSLVVPQLLECGKILVQEIPVVLDRLTRYIQSNTNLMAILNEAGISLQKNSLTDWQGMVQNAGKWLVSGLGGVMGSLMSVVSGVFSTLTTMVIAFIFSLYLLAGKETLYKQVKKMCVTYLKPDMYDKLGYVYRTVNGSFHRFIVGQCTEAVILGALCMIGMWIFRFPYASMIGVFIGFTALIPVAGAYIGAAVGAFMILTVSPVQALLFLLFIVVLQQLEGNIIYPKVVGSSIGLPGIWVLAAVTIGGSVLGIGGMLLGVPIAAACYQMLRDDIKKRNSK